MLLEIRDQKAEAIQIFQDVPDELKKHLLSPSAALVAKGSTFKALMQEFKGVGFSAWYSCYWMKQPTVLKARAGIPVLELRIALRNSIGGTWENISNAALPVHYFQMGFVPYVSTSAVFDAPQQYSTFDIHFDLSFLEAIGLDYKTLERFIRRVQKAEPAELSQYPHRCTPLMIDAVNGILFNSFTEKGKRRLLQNNVTNILIGALEVVGTDELKNLPLSANDIDALHHVKMLIEQHSSEYLSNDVLVSKAFPNLNAFKLSYGFKRVFGINPYEYYLQLRFEKGKALLREGYPVSAVAYELEYDSAATFIRGFKKRFGYTPKQFQKYGD